MKVLKFIAILVFFSFVSLAAEPDEDGGRVFGPVLGKLIDRHEVRAIGVVGEDAELLCKVGYSKDKQIAHQFLLRKGEQVVLLGSPKMGVPLDLAYDVIKVRERKSLVVGLYRNGGLLTCEFYSVDLSEGLLKSKKMLISLNPLKIKILKIAKGFIYYGEDVVCEISLAEKGFNYKINPLNLKFFETVMVRDGVLELSF